VEFQPGDLVEASWFEEFADSINLTQARGPAIVIKVWPRKSGIQVWIPALGKLRLIGPYQIVRRLSPRQEDNNEVSKG